MFSLYGDLSAENRMSRLGRETRRAGPNSGSRSASSATSGALISSSYRRRLASKKALLLFMRRLEKKPTKSPFQPLNWPATAATLALARARDQMKKDRTRSGGPFDLHVHGYSTAMPSWSSPSGTAAIWTRVSDPPAPMLNAWTELDVPLWT